MDYIATHLSNDIGRHIVIAAPPVISAVPTLRHGLECSPTLSVLGSVSTGEFYVSFRTRSRFNMTPPAMPTSISELKCLVQIAYGLPRSCPLA